MKNNGKGKELIIQIIIDPEGGILLGLSQYGRVFVTEGETWVLNTGRELHESVVVDDTGRMALKNVEDIKPKRKQPMNVLNDVEISSDNLRRLYEYFTDPAQGGNTIRYTSKDTGVPLKEVKAFYKVFEVGMG